MPADRMSGGAMPITEPPTDSAMPLLRPLSGECYIGRRPDPQQLLALDLHVSHFSGEDPGRLTLAQFEQDPDQATTPFNHNWVDRYTGVLRWEIEADWLFQTKFWITHQDIDSRAQNPGPASTTFGYEDFNNGGLDVRARMKWGEDGMFRGSALTFGTMIYHGNAPFKRYNLTLGNTGPDFLVAPRGTA